MAELERQDRVARLVEKHVRDRNMDPSSITNHYSVNHFGFELDPDFFEVRLTLGWGFFTDAPRHLDHITRNMLISVLLAHRDRPGCYHQGKKAVMMGATYEKMLEAYESGHIVGGGPVIINGMQALRRMKEEGIEPGCQDGPFANKWLPLGHAGATAPQGNPSAAKRDPKATIATYYSDKFGAGDLAADLKFGAELDPDYLERYLHMAWTVFETKPQFLDPVRREMARILILAYQVRREELTIHVRRALDLGATPLQLLEAFEVGYTGGGSAVLHEGLRVLRQLSNEGAFPKR
jgi:alkylhydroperoxidase/carboxymuconolactone decarboxylase family protein YurZ